VVSRRVDHQPGGLVDHDQVVILVHHVQINGLGLIIQLRLNFHFQRQRFITGQLLFGLGLGSVDRQHAILDPGLQARPGKAVKQLCRHLVYPLSGVLRLHLFGALNFFAAKMSHIKGSSTCA